jgi:hypothetical protein
MAKRQKIRIKMAKANNIIGLYFRVKLKMMKNEWTMGEEDE